MKKNKKDLEQNLGRRFSGYAQNGVDRSQSKNFQYCCVLLGQDEKSADECVSFGEINKRHVLLVRWFARTFVGMLRLFCSQVLKGSGFVFIYRESIELKAQSAMLFNNVGSDCSFKFVSELEISINSIDLHHSGEF